MGNHFERKPAKEVTEKIEMIISFGEITAFNGNQIILKKLKIIPGKNH